MILSLFAFAGLIAALLIILGLVFSADWSGFAIIGSVFLFLLSLVLIQGNLEYPIGSNVNSSYTYNSNGTITTSTQSLIDVYDRWNDSNSHYFGYFLSVVALTLFIGCLLSMRRGK